MSRTLIAGAVLGVGLIFGGTLLQSGVPREAQAATASARLLDEVIARVHDDFLDSVTTADLQGKAASGLLRERNVTPGRDRRVPPPSPRGARDPPHRS